MRIDAIGLPIDRLQLRPDSLRQPSRPAFVPLTAAPVVRTATRPDQSRPAQPPVPFSGRGAAAQAAMGASVAAEVRTAAASTNLIDQLRKQRLSLGRMLGDVNRHLAEPAQTPAD